MIRAISLLAAILASGILLEAAASPGQQPAAAKSGEPLLQSASEPDRVANNLAEEEEDFNTLMMRATVKISHEKSTATGFLLTAPDGNRSILVTAAHVLEATPGEETTVEFRRRLSEGNYQKEPLKITIRKEGKPRWTRHPSEDVAAMEIMPPGNADLPKIPVSTLATDELIKKYKVHPGDNLSCLGYPHRNEANEAGFPILRSGAISSFPLVPTQKSKTLLVTANIFEGDSGGPIYLARPSMSSPGKDNIKLILGLIHGQRFLDEEMKMVYGNMRIRHRLGIAVVVHASFISETIARLP